MANGFDAQSEAFRGDVIDDIITAGATAETAFGNDVAATMNMASGLSEWFDNLSTNSRNHVVVLGDSNATDDPSVSTRWPQLLKADLLTFTGKAEGGAGYRHLGLAEWNIPVSNSQWTPLGKTSEPIPRTSTHTGTAADNSPNGFGYVIGGQAANATWTRPAGIAAFDRFHLFGTDDDFLVQQSEYSIDGGAFTATAYNLAPTGQNFNLVTQEVVANIVTDLRYRGSASGFPAYLNGIALYANNGAAGQLVMHNLAVGGNSVVEAAGAATAQRMKFLDIVAPKLTIVWLGTNEQTNVPPAIPQMSLDTFYTYYTRVAQKARQHGDCLMIYPHITDIPNFLHLQPTPRLQHEFERVARKVAYENDCAYMSIHQLMGSWDRANARGFMADSHHLTTAGHAFVFKHVSRAIRRVS